MYISFCLCSKCGLVKFPSSETAFKRRMITVLTSAKKEVPGAFCSCLPLSNMACGGCIAGDVEFKDGLIALLSLIHSHSGSNSPVRTV